MGNYVLSRLEGVEVRDRSALMLQNLDDMMSDEHMDDTHSLIARGRRVGKHVDFVSHENIPNARRDLSTLLLGIC